MKRLMLIALLSVVGCADAPPVKMTTLYFGDSEKTVLSQLRPPDAREVETDGTVVDKWDGSGDDVPLLMNNPRRITFKDDKLVGFQYLWHDVQVKYK